VRRSLFFLPSFLLLSSPGAWAQNKPAPEPTAVPNGKPAVDPVAVPAKPAEPAPVPPAPGPAPKILPPPATTAPPPPANGLVLGPPPAHIDSNYPISTRVAITEFKVSGDESSRTLAMRMQDGFVVGLTRTAPLYVLDSIDVARYVDTLPELQKCDGAICIKRLGQELDVSHVIRVSVSVTGNSYDMTARLFRTQGPSPADVPVDTQTRFCPVCTVDEARQKIVALGEAMKNPIESWLALQRPPAPPPPPPPSWSRPLAATGIALGFATMVGGGALLANAKPDTRLWPAIGGGLIGVGASLAALSTYVLVVMPGDSPKAPPKVAITGSF
jgi:hypothetical protein